MDIPVALCHCEKYNTEIITDIIKNLLKLFLDNRSLYQKNILVKPNFVAPQNTKNSCTHPVVIKTVCEYLLEKGAHVIIGDSPGFGSAQKVAKKSGLLHSISNLPVNIITLKYPHYFDVPFGGKIGISSQALASDLIINVPKLKAHSQLALSGALKNLFGCVVGFRKALVHRIRVALLMVLHVI
jgi:uncharacterized protein (DUF362 family)